MNQDKRRTIGAYLQKRIEETQEWANGSLFQSELIKSVSLGAFTCKIKPVSFLGVLKNAKEKVGISFLLIWKDEKGDSYCSKIDVRINEKGFEGPDGFYKDTCRGGGWPYISFYAVDIVNECITYKHIKEIDAVLSIQDFYHKWINVACNKNKGEKLLSNKQPYTSILEQDRYKI